MAALIRIGLLVALVIMLVAEKAEAQTPAQLLAAQPACSSSPSSVPLILGPAGN
jgi:hypothetical protein